MKLGRIAFALSLLSSVVALSAQQAPDATVLRVTRVILYKTGIGYFEHLGSVTGNQSLAVQFTGDQLDDVLKSLTALDLGDGRITGISYDSPTPAERRLQALRVPLAQNANTTQVLSALRGARIEVRTGATLVTGRLLNIERRVRTTGDQPSERDELSLVTDAGEIMTVDLDGNTRVRVVDADLRQDVSRYLDIAASNADRSSRRVVLSTVGAGQRQLLVSYVGEAAVWKSTYRLVFPSAGDAQPLLQGWAVVDNVSAADWDNIELSLVAGAPQTFRQPLATPLFATRPLVPLAASAGLAPQTHSAALVRGDASIRGVVRGPGGAVLPGVQVSALDPAGAEISSSVTDAQGRYQLVGLAGTIDLKAELQGFITMVSRLTLPPNGSMQRDLTLSVGGLQETVSVTAESARRPNPRVGGSIDGIAGGVRAAPPAAAPSREAIEQRLFDQTIVASGANLGELFEYRIKDRVTIRRNQSALVPILHARVAAERISLWNDAMGTRPRRAVWLTNSSDLTLDAGSLSVVDAGAFAGEGLIDSVKPGERRLVSFAADIGVQVAARLGDGPTRITRIRIAQGVVTQDSEHRARRTYTIRNDNRDARVVVVEHPARPQWKLVGGSTPTESTATVHRFRVNTPAGQTTTLDVDEVQVGSTAFAVNEFDRDRLIVIAERGDARAALERAMAPVFAKSAEIDELETEIQKRDNEIMTIGQDQERLRENMAVLKGSSTERQLLERYTRQLDAQETRLEMLKRELVDLQEKRVRAERELGELIMAITIDVTL